MKRSIYPELLKWKSSPRRKPLMLYGARQVGKTYILKEFGQREYEQLLYINCFRNQDVAKIFDTDVNVNRIIQDLSILYGVKAGSGSTLIFFDEAQEIPAVISSLKYFYEQRPDIHVVVAGSLLGVLNLEGESFPVGKVDILHLYPMNFKEFLCAMGRDELADVLDTAPEQRADIFSSQYIALLRQYYFTGGMPEAVYNYTINQDIDSVRAIQNNILRAYEADFSKHTGISAQRVRQVWESIPSQLAKENKKFIFGALRRGARASEYELAIQWLLDAGLVYKVAKVRDLKIPLNYYTDNSAFKLYLLDVGLLGAMSETPARDILTKSNIFTEYKGSFTENYALCELICAGVSTPKYYSKDNSTLETDFVIQCQSAVYPIEVKAEENVHSKSLRSLVSSEYASYSLKGVRLSMKPYIRQDWMINVPLYAAGELVKILSSTLALA